MLTTAQLQVYMDAADQISGLLVNSSRVRQVGTTQFSYYGNGKVSGIGGIIFSYYSSGEFGSMSRTGPNVEVMVHW